MFSIVDRVSSMCGVALDAWSLLGIDNCLECLEFAWNDVLLGMLGVWLEFGVVWNAWSLRGMFGVCLEFKVAWNAWVCLEFGVAWNA